MIYRRQIPVEFNHCDPAGIVFYPRYFEMTNSVVENFFADVVGYSFSRLTMQERSGVPTVRLEADFHAPSRLGDKLLFTLQVKKLGKSSVGFELRASADGQDRMTVAMVIVYVTPQGRAAPWPDQILQAFETFMRVEV